MAIQDLSELAFAELLQQYLSPSSPIHRLQALRGREDQITQITRAFHSPGRQVFIYGDRGVGKSSLALAVANYLAPEDSRPIQIACNRGSFFTLIRSACQQLLGAMPVQNAEPLKGKVGMSAYGFSAELEASLARRDVPILADLNQAVTLFRFCAEARQSEAVIIFDEFDDLASDDDRALFSDFIKQVGDQRIPIKLFFTGIGRALDELLASHHSCYRYLATVDLKPLAWDGRLAIIDTAAAALRISVDSSTRFRIAAISDGFPHYVHLICEKLFWAVQDDPEVITQTDPDHYLSALAESVKDIEPFLKELYALATQKYNNDYQEILWAVADHHELKRRSIDIYQSYLEIMRQRPHPPLDRSKFNNRMGYLKNPSHGEILIGSRQGWYELREPILRGYIRLRAEHEGIALAKEHPQQREARSLGLFNR